MTNFGKRLILEQRMKDNQTEDKTQYSQSNPIQNKPSDVISNSNVRKSKAVDHFMQDDTYEPVRPSIANGQIPQYPPDDEQDSDDQNSMVMSGGVKSQHSQQQSFTS